MPDFIEEFVAIVDENNQEIGGVTRSIMREQRLIHRACYILVFNREGQLLVLKRTFSKDIYPGCWEIAAGGVVLVGERYEEAAARELAEELGISGARLEHLFDQYYEDGANRVWGRIYRCLDNGPFALQEEEVAATRFMTLEEIRELSQEQAFTPDSLVILDELAKSFPEGILTNFRKKR